MLCFAHLFSCLEFVAVLLLVLALLLLLLTLFVLVLILFVAVLLLLIHRQIFIFIMKAHGLFLLSRLMWL